VTQSDLDWLKSFQPVETLRQFGEKAERSPLPTLEQSTLLLEFAKEKISERELTIIAGRLTAHQTYAEIASALGVSTSRVQQIFVRAIKKLKYHRSRPQSFREVA
jgi:RNA polymerase sigma factor (sigma-70 family)